MFNSYVTRHNQRVLGLETNFIFWTVKPSCFNEGLNWKIMGTFPGNLVREILWETGGNGSSRHRLEMEFPANHYYLTELPSGYLT